MLLSEFTSWVGGVPYNLPVSISGISQDSRTMQPGWLYVALRGERFDGHGFVAAALARGAAAALVEESWPAPPEAAAWPLLRVADTRRALAQAAGAWRAQHPATIIGITGSSGKTTTKEMVAAMLRPSAPLAATVGNLNNELGLPLSLLRMQPEARYGIFEAGSNHPGEIARLAQILQPRIALITCVGSAHIEHFGSTAAIAREKGALLQALPHDGRGILSLECAHYELLRELSGAPLTTTSLCNQDADYYAQLNDSLTHLEITENLSGLRLTCPLPIPGRHNASNLLLAYATVRICGLEPHEAIAGVTSLKLPQMRWQLSEREGVRYINDAYNANAESMCAALGTFAQTPCEGRRIAILGDMLELGTHATALHRQVGSYAAETHPDLLLGVGAYAGGALLASACESGYAPARCHACRDAIEARALLAHLVRPGDLVLLKGSRGMRLETVLSPPEAVPEK